MGDRDGGEAEQEEADQADGHIPEAAEKLPTTPARQALSQQGAGGGGGEEVELGVDEGEQAEE